MPSTEAPYLSRPRELNVSSADVDLVDLDDEIVDYEGQRFTLESEYSRAAMYVGDNGDLLYVWVDDADWSRF